MNTKTPAIPLKLPEKVQTRKPESTDQVFLPPLPPSSSAYHHQQQRLQCHRDKRSNSETLWARDVSCGSRFKKRPYRVLHIGATPLMHACQQGDRARVLKLLEEQESTIGYRDRTLRNALHYCMDAGSAGAVAAAAPDLVNSQDAEGHTPLHLAVIAGDTRLVAVLLANGADVNAKDLEGHSVLHWATVCGEAECVRLVLAAGARPSTADLRGSTPLHYAAQCCGATASADLAVPKKTALKVLQTLLEFGAKVDAKDEDGRQPIMWAAGAGSVEAVLALARVGGTAAAGASDKDGLTALHCAASRGHARCIEALVNLCGAALDHVDDIGCSALHYAATLGHADATALMLKLGADPNRQDRKGRTAALCAAAKGQLETLKILSQNGASLRTKTVRGTGLAHEAASSGRVELIHWLARRRASLLDLATPQGKTALHVAALHGHIDVCKSLIDHGVRINPILITNEGNRMTPLDAALHRGHRSCAKYIQMHGGTTAQQIPSHITGSKFNNVSARERTKRDLTETSSDSECCARRRRCGKYKEGPLDNYYEERWFEKRTRKRNGSSFGRLSRRNSRSFSEEEIHLSKKKSFFRKNRQRRARSESARNDSEESIDKKIERKGASEERRYEGLTDDDYEESLSSDYSQDERPRRRANVVCGNESLSEDSLEEVIVVRRSLERKSDKLVSGWRSKDRNVRRDRTKNKSRKPSNGSIDAATSPADKSSTTNPKGSKLEKDDRPTTDSTSQEAVERVIVKAMVHKDQTSDGPNFDRPEEISTSKKDEKIEDDHGEITDGTERTDDALLTKVISLKKDVERIKSQKPSSKLEFAEPTDDGSTIMSPPPDAHNEGRDDTKEGNSEGSTDGRSLDSVSKVISEAKNENGEIGMNGIVGSERDEAEVAEDKAQVESTIDENTNDVNEKQLENGKKGGHRKESVETSERLFTKDGETKTNGERDKSLTRTDSELTQADVYDQQEMTVHFVGNEQDDRSQSKEHSDEKEQQLVDSARGKSADSSDVKDSDVTKDEENIDGHNSNGHLKTIPTGKGITGKTHDKANADTDKTGQMRFVNERYSRSAKFSKSSKTSRSLTKGTGVESPDGSAIVAVIESPDWDEEEVDREIRDVIGEENTEQSTEPEDNEMGIVRVLPSTSEDEPLISSVRAVGPRIVASSRRGIVGTTKLQSPVVMEHSRLDQKQQRRDSAGRDSGIEPSPRISRIPRRRATKCCPITEKQQLLSMESITKDVQISLRRYHLERKIFFQLMELKRLQIRHGRANEHVLVKRQVEAYNRTGMSGPILGVARYDRQPFTFRHFETFLYEQLRKLQRQPPPSSSDFCTEAKQCTEMTHRCHHATSAYTATPAYTYLGGGAPERKHFLPKLEDRGRGQMTVELTHGEEKQVIALPAERLDRTKRYFVTFTVRGEDRDVENPKSTFGAQRNAKSV